MKYERHIGEIIFYNSAKEFGFIKMVGRRIHYYFQITNFQAKPVYPKKGMIVRFSIKEFSKNGISATNIQILEEDILRQQ